MFRHLIMILALNIMDHINSTLNDVGYRKTNNIYPADADVCALGMVCAIYYAICHMLCTH